MDSSAMIEATQDATQNTVEEMNAFVSYFQNHVGDLITFALQVALAIIFFLIGRKVIQWICNLLRKSMERANADTGAIQFLCSLLKYILYALMLFSIATHFGIDTTSVAALVASAGVALGLALQGSLSNLAGGILILILKPFQVGDYIIEDTHKNEGTVKEIQIFYTKISTIDNRTIIVPNGTLMNNSLTNVTEKDERMLELKVGIGYGSDLKKAKDIVLDLLEQDPSVMKARDRLVYVDELAESSVVLGIRSWVPTGDYLYAKWRLLEEIKLRFDEEGIEIPFPQMSIHMKEKQERS